MYAKLIAVNIIIAAATQITGCGPMLAGALVGSGAVVAAGNEEDCSLKDSDQGTIMNRAGCAGKKAKKAAGDMFNKIMGDEENKKSDSRK
jgi:hypothetical protein